MIQWWWLLVVVGVSVAVSVAWGLVRRRARRIEIGALCSALEEMKHEIGAIRTESKKAQDLAKVHMEANAEFEKQRDEAWKRYHAAGIGAGNAQAMLLRSLEAAVRELNMYREKDGKNPIQVNPGLRQIVDEFKREHVA